ncbi:hypothetical protein BRDID11002_63900 [Bradyrhizobium diazoefficiens]
MLAGMERIDLDLVLAAVSLDAARGLRGELQQRLDRARRRIAGAQLQHLAEQHQHGDDGSRLEIDGHRAAMAAEGVREDLRHDRAEDAVNVSDAGAHRDQREHVEVAGDQRLPAADEERPAGPQHHGRGEDELDPVRERLVDPVVRAGEMAAHLQHHGRQRQHAADPEPPRHVGEFGIGAGLQARDLRLQRHAADRAAAGSDLADLRVHRAGVDRARRHLRLARLLLGEVFCGIGGEFGAASGRAEMEGLAVMVEPVLRGRGVDRHAADGVEDFRRGVALVMGMMMGVAGMIAVSAAA